MANAVTFTLDQEATRKLEMLSYRLKKNKSQLVREMIKQAYEQSENTSSVSVETVEPVTA